MVAGIWSKISKNETAVAKRTNKMEPLARIVMVLATWTQWYIGKWGRNETLWVVSIMFVWRFEQRLSDQSPRNYDWHTILNLLIIVTNLEIYRQKYSKVCRFNIYSSQWSHGAERNLRKWNIFLNKTAKKKKASVFRIPDEFSYCMQWMLESFGRKKGDMLIWSQGLLEFWGKKKSISKWWDHQ